MRARIRLSEKLKALFRYAGFKDELGVVATSLWRLSEYDGALDWEQVDAMVVALPEVSVQAASFKRMLEQELEAMGGSALEWAQIGFPGAKFAEKLQLMDITREAAFQLLTKVHDLLHGGYGMGAVWMAYKENRRSGRTVEDGGAKVRSIRGLYNRKGS